jgi:hypothetical protein
MDYKESINIKNKEIDGIGLCVLQNEGSPILLALRYKMLINSSSVNTVS